MVLFTVVFKLLTLVNVLYADNLLVNVLLKAVVNKYDPIVLLKFAVNSNESTVTFRFDIEVIVELTVKFKFATDVMVLFIVFVKFDKLVV